MSCIMELACRCLWACLVFFVFYSPTVCQAHPHVFIDFHPLLRIKDNQLQGIDMHWTFDRFTSETIIEDIDKNNNRQFDPEERPYFDENYRSIEHEANFFLFMYMGEKIFDDFEATLKQVQILDNHIHYTIPITLNEPISAGARKSLLIEIVDPEMFVAFTLKSTSKETGGTSLIRFNPLPKREDCFAVEFLTEQASSPNLEQEQNSTANKQQVHGGAMRDAPANDSIFKRFRTRLFALQGKYNRKLGDLVMDTKDEFSFQIAGVLLAFSFLYGMLHALGPGHGKSVVVGYFLQKKARPIQVLITTGGITIIHTGSAILLALLFQTILSSYAGMQRIRFQSYISFFVACFILLIGIGLLIHLVRKHRRGFEERSPSNSSTSKWVYSAGLIPCPLSITVMLAAVMHNILFLGLIAVVSISAGMMVVLTGAGWLAMATKSTVYSYSSRRWGFASRLHDYLEYLGAGLIILFGLGLTMLYMPKF